MDKLLRRKLYMLWYHMKERCYDDSHPRYHLYGGRGVTMCGTWLAFEDFLESIVDVEGYSESLILDGLLHLDKDSKDINNKLYSPDTCCFISKEENNKHKPNQMKAFIATSPDGVEYLSANQSEFALQHNLKQNKISECLKGKNKKHIGWTFRYAD